MKYSYNLSDFPNGKVDLDSFQDQIRASTITVALDYISESIVVDVFFKSDLSVDEKTTLDEIVATHTGIPALEDIPIVKAEILTEHIKWIEQGSTTQSLFAAESLIIDVSANESETIVDFTWAYDIALMSATIGVSEEMIGDDFEVHVSPNSLVGVLTAPLSIGDTSINVNETVIQNAKRGFNIGIYNPDPSSKEEFVIGQVKTIDSINNKIELAAPAILGGNAMDYLSICANLIPYIYIDSHHKIEIGKSIPTGQRITEGTVVRICYHSKNNLSKKISFFVEYLY